MLDSFKNISFGDSALLPCTQIYIDPQQISKYRFMSVSCINVKFYLVYEFETIIK